MTTNVAATSKATNHGCALAYRVDGSDQAPVLLLSNSLGATVDMWEGQVSALSSRFRLIRYDTRGHGRSDAPRGDYTIDQLGRDALTVLDAAGVKRAHVCGLSLGGVTAMWLGVHAPERVETLLLASTAARIASADLWNTRISQVQAGGTESIADQVMSRWFTERFRQSHAPTVSVYRAMLASTAAHGYIGCCAALRAADVSGDIARIRIPTLVISGSSDPATPPADGEAIRDRIAGAGMLTLEASHLLNVEQRDAFNQAVLEFITHRRTC